MLLIFFSRVSLICLPLSLYCSPSSISSLSINYRNLTLLSFGEEQEEMDAELTSIAPKEKLGSSHDALNDPLLSKVVAPIEEAEEKREAEEEKERRKIEKVEKEENGERKGENPKDEAEKDDKEDHQSYVFYLSHISLSLCISDITLYLFLSLSIVYCISLSCTYSYQPTRNLTPSSHSFFLCCLLPVLKKEDLKSRVSREKYLVPPPPSTYCFSLFPSSLSLLFSLYLPPDPLCTFFPFCTKPTERTA